ncbi:aminotransferase class V-fold PLP-dependent enzyme [Kineobactrum salinum]|uniref:Aminotransferase class V-fold PLP-dependent enzyme n=1 Tax=Kineobactrum salinum TaxID=2708301 RepID=A0A6C0U521_9GAMM|nr:aminotransferase class V-fold PLP-dependent enzyme [Kineobactrum salinum]QIB64544.1 aminotransferase class V-fold PLP-dependent enzyme [Kineobactrum salinum]
MNWELFRERFPVLERRTYLNNCSYGALSTDVKSAFETYINDRLYKGTDWNYWVARNNGARDAVAALLGTSSDQIAITASASAGINSIISALDFKGDRHKVVISDFEFPANAQVWYAQESRGAEVVRVGSAGSYIPTEHFEDAIDEETLIVAVTQVCFRNGARLDIPAIVELAHAKGAMVLVDGYQGLGTIDFNVSEVQPDFVVGGMVKYLLGTAGIGFLYARRDLIENLVPTVTGWFAQSDIFAMDITQYSPAPDARRFEMGTPPVICCYAAEAGIKILLEAGLPAIEQRVAELTSAIIREAKTAGYTLALPEASEYRGPMVTLKTHDEHALVSWLDKQDIVTSSRSGNLRIAAHFYNSHADIERLFAALKRKEHLLL